MSDDPKKFRVVKRGPLRALEQTPPGGVFDPTASPPEEQAFWERAEEALKKEQEETWRSRPPLL